MKNKTFVLEIAVESVTAAQAAERGGADRIELCTELRCGGLTPSTEMMRKARDAVRVPIFVMTRPRAGDFSYTQEEFRAMQRGIELAREMKMDGVVLGVLRDHFAVDVERTGALVLQARPMQVTFHRAFDVCSDLVRAMDDVIETGANRILTSGGNPDVVSGLCVLQALIAQAGEGIVIVPGGGITPENFGEVQRKTGAREFHSGLGQVLAYGSEDIRSFENGVRKLAGQRKAPI